MDPASLTLSVVGLASLFSTCLEALDKVQSYSSFSTDSHVLNTRFKATRARFEQWGRGVSIKHGQLLDHHHPALDDEDTSPEVWDLLAIIIKTICDADDDVPTRSRGLRIGQHAPSRRVSASRN